MKISTKGRYAVRIMAELAKREGYVSAFELSNAQDITIKYLEKIISILCKASLIESARGAQGGYKLTKDPKEYSVAEILRATDDLPQLVPCICGSKKCERFSHCESVSCWEKLTLIINDYLSKVTLEDLINKKV